MAAPTATFAEQLHALQDAVEENADIDVIMLKGCIGDEQGIDELIRCMCKCKRLKRIRLAGIGLTDGAVHSMLACIKSSATTLETLDLSSNMLTETALQDLLTVLPQCALLSALDLHRNSIGPSQALCQLLHVPTLHYLNLSLNNLSRHGAQCVAKTLPLLTRLSELRLTDNEIDDRGASAVAFAVVRCIRLSKLDLSGNHISTRAAADIATEIIRNPHLRVVNLRGNRIDHRGTATLIAAATKANHLTINLEMQHPSHAHDGTGERQVSVSLTQSAPTINTSLPSSTIAPSHAGAPVALRPVFDALHRPVGQDLHAVPSFPHVFLPSSLRNEFSANATTTYASTQPAHLLKPVAQRSPALARPLFRIGPPTANTSASSAPSSRPSSPNSRADKGSSQRRRSQSPPIKDVSARGSTRTRSSSPSNADPAARASPRVSFQGNLDNGNTLSFQGSIADLDMQPPDIVKPHDASATPSVHVHAPSSVSLGSLNANRPDLIGPEGISIHHVLAPSSSSDQRPSSELALHSFAKPSGSRSGAESIELQSPMSNDTAPLLSGVHVDTPASDIIASVQETPMSIPEAITPLPASLTPMPDSSHTITPHSMQSLALQCEDEAPRKARRTLSHYGSRSQLEKYHFIEKQPPITVVEFMPAGEVLHREMRRAEMLSHIRTVVPETRNDVIRNIPRLGPRDIRQLDHAFAAVTEPSILVREHVILFTMDPYRAVILRNRCLLAVPIGADSILSIVMDRLQSPTLTTLAGEEELPFEFKALEVIFEASVALLVQEYRATENSVVATLAVLRSTRTGAGTAQLDKLRMLKSEVDKFHSRANGMYDAIEQVLDEDEDLFFMQLTKMWKDPSIESTDDFDDHDTSEVLLERFLRDVSRVRRQLNLLTNKIEATEALLELKQSSASNKLLSIDLGQSLLLVCLNFLTAASAIFGMNLNSFVQENAYWFSGVIGISVGLSTLIFIAGIFIFYKLGLLIH